MPYLKCEVCGKEVKVEFRAYQRKPVCSACSKVYFYLEGIFWAGYKWLDAGPPKSEMSKGAWT